MGLRTAERSVRGQLLSAIQSGRRQPEGSRFVVSEYRLAASGSGNDPGPRFAHRCLLEPPLESNQTLWVNARRWVVPGSRIAAHR